MKAKVYYHESTGAVNVAHDGGSTVIFRNGQTCVTIAESEHGPQWQPLLTESEFLSRHLVLRKLGEGEAIKGRLMRYSQASDTWSGWWTGGPEVVPPDSEFDYYELPPLTTEEPEPSEHETDAAETIVAAVESLAGEVTEPWTRELKEPELKHVPMKKVGTIRGKFVPVDEVEDDPENRRLAKELAARTVDFFADAIARVTPAPNSVGERLTSPAMGEWIVCFRDGFSPYVYRWERSDDTSKLYRYYRWHGPIPQEPPAKVEPPKFPKPIGIVREKDRRHPDVVFVTAINQGDEVLQGVDEEGLAYETLSIQLFDLITDDPAYPPSPELAALFAGEEGQ